MGLVSGNVGAEATLTIPTQGYHVIKECFDVLILVNLNRTLKNAIA